MGLSGNNSSLGQGQMDDLNMGEKEKILRRIISNDPNYRFVRNPEIRGRDGDGYPELMVKFDRKILQETSGEM